MLSWTLVGWVAFGAYLAGFTVAIVVAQYRLRYAKRMLRRGVAVIVEANKVWRDFPQEYPRYRQRASFELVEHGVGALERLLPEEDL